RVLSDQGVGEQDKTAALLLRPELHSTRETPACTSGELTPMRPGRSTSTSRGWSVPWDCVGLCGTVGLGDSPTTSFPGGRCRLGMEQLGAFMRAARSASAGVA